MRAFRCLPVLVLLASACGRPDERYGDAVRQLKTYRTACRTFQAEVLRVPTEAEGLEVLVADTGLAGWNGPYLRPAEIRPDPWGNTIRYKPLGEDGFEILSPGPDRLFGTNDDVVVGG